MDVISDMNAKVGNKSVVEVVGKWEVPEQNENLRMANGCQC